MCSCHQTQKWTQRRRHGSCRLRQMFSALIHTRTAKHKHTCSPLTCACAFSRAQGCVLLIQRPIKHALTHKPKTPNPTERRCAPYVCVCIRVKKHVTSATCVSTAARQAGLAPTRRPGLQPSAMCRCTPAMRASWSTIANIV